MSSHAVEKLGAKPRRIASFYVGRREGDQLLYAGKVRGGFTEAEARHLRDLRRTRTSLPPWPDLEPKVAEIRAQGAGENGG
jgi:ATP-dependent DNA ligase